MHIELKIESVEEFLTMLEAVRGPAPVALSEAVVGSGDGAIDEEILDIIGQELVKEQKRLDDLAQVNDMIRDELREIRTEFKIQRGALDETIAQVRELQKMAQHVGPWTVEPKKNGKTAMIRGIYCRFCGKELDTKKSQKIFCSQACAGRWQAQHKGERPTPRYTLKNEMIGTTVVAGVGVRG